MMYKFKQSLIGLIGVLILVGIATSVLPRTGRGASGAGGGAPTSQTQNVNVVNTPAVTAQQSGTWNVGINGTPTVAVSNFPATSSVSISGTPTVGLDFANNTVKFDSVNNTVKIDTTNPLPVRDVDNPARQPFLTSTFASLADGSTFVAANPNISVPAGKRLVIEQISLSANLPSGQKPVFSMNVRDNFAQVIFDQALPTTLQGTFGPIDTFQASLPTRIYLDASEQFSFVFFRTDGNGSAGVRFSFSGHFVDVP
jgi:hypothetical protein